MMPKFEKLLYRMVLAHPYPILPWSVCARGITWSQYQHLDTFGQREATLMAKRCFRSSSRLLNTDSDTDETLLSDPKYNFVKEICRIPDSGHCVFVIQPDLKVKNPNRHLPTADLKLEENCALIKTLPGWHVVGKMTVPVKTTSKSELFSKQTLSRLSSRVTSMTGVSAVFMGVDVLLPAQLARLQSALEVPIFDRFSMVLQIFKDHARTRESKLQVALAEIPYIRSRLSEVSADRHDCQTGRTHHIGGSGETWLQIRKQLLQERELKLQKALVQVKGQRSLLRKKRLKKQIPTVAVVGYTNAGKTSLIQALTSDPRLQPRDQLFATLDVTCHAGTLPNKLSVMYVDTVGFLSDIPVMLIHAFAATLEDALLADVIINVCDLSHPDWQSQKQTVITTLQSMLSQERMDSVIEVYNKLDLTPQFRKADEMCVSARTGQGMDALRHLIQIKVLDATRQMEKTFRVPMSGEHLSWLYKNATVTEAHPDNINLDYLNVNVVISEAAYAKFKVKFSKSKIKL